MLKVLIACEFSGIVREAFSERGHDAYSCDLLDTEIPGQHIKGDVLGILENGWDMMIAHPPCTYLCNSGVRWLYSNKDRMQEMHKAAMFFKSMLNAPIKKIAIENPIPHKYARDIIGYYQQLIQPWMFGHNETKATCLWLRGLPPLFCGITVTERKSTVHRMSPGPDRSKNRSRTFQGIADAMASQWG